MVEILRTINTILLIVSMFPLTWALFDILKSLPRTEGGYKRTGALMAIGFVMLGAIAVLSLLSYFVESGHAVAMWRTTAYSIANLCFSTAYVLMRRGLI